MVLNKDSKSHASMESPKKSAGIYQMLMRISHGIKDKKNKKEMKKVVQKSPPQPQKELSNKKKAVMDP